MEWHERPEIREMFKKMSEETERAVLEMKMQRFKDGELRWYEKDWKPAAP